MGQSISQISILSTLGYSFNLGTATIVIKSLLFVYVIHFQSSNAHVQVRRLLRQSKHFPNTILDIGNRSYIIKNVIGQGHQAVVYDAIIIEQDDVVDPSDANVHFAIKESEEEGALKQEFAIQRAMYQIEPNHIINPIAIDESGTSIVMDKVDGKDLEQMTDIPLDMECKFLYQIGGTILNAHQYRIYHRDIATRNVMASNDGKLKLIDWALGSNTGVYNAKDAAKDIADLVSTAKIICEKGGGRNCDEVDADQCNFKEFVETRCPDDPSAYGYFGILSDPAPEKEGCCLVM